MSAILNTKRLTERRLNTLSIPVAYENASFTPPSTAYLRVQFSIRTPDDPVIGDKYYRERISLQVFVADQLNIGTANAISIAESVKALFPKGETFDELGTNIYVLTTPRISGSVVTRERLIVPVLIDLVAEVFN